MKILVTGTAGFIGFHLANKLLEQGVEVVGIDNINNYYSTGLKYARLAEAGISGEAENWHKRIVSTKNPAYSFVRMNLEDRDPQLDLDYVPNEARKCKVDIAINESFGFGGQNNVVIIKRYEKK